MHVEHFFTALHSAHSLRLEPVFYPRLRSSLYITLISSNLYSEAHLPNFLPTFGW